MASGSSQGSSNQNALSRRTMQALSNVGSASSDDDSDQAGAQFQQNVLVSRSGLPQIVQTLRRVIQVPIQIEPLWRVGLGAPIDRYYAQHETYRLYNGTYGPYNNVIIKEANKNDALARDELNALSSFTGIANFQQIRGSGISSTKIFLVVEKCGESLSSIFDRFHHINQGHLPFLYSELIKSIKYVHDAGFVHRDLNCDNVYLLLNNAEPKVTIGGLKHAKDAAGSRVSIPGCTDLPLHRLKYRYHGYGNALYSWRTEYFLVACIMNALLNSRDLTSQDGNVVVPTLPLRIEMTYIGYHVLHLNKVMMSAEFQTLRTVETPIKGHHLFWEPGKTYFFICSCYDILEGLRVKSHRGAPGDRYAAQRDLARLKNSLEVDHAHLFSDNWPQQWGNLISSAQVFNFLANQRVSFKTVFSIIATFRNRGAHHYEDQDDVRNFFGALPDQYLQKWLEMLPGLINHLVRWVLVNNLHISVQLTSYFEQPLSGFWQLVRETPLNDYIPLHY